MVHRLVEQAIGHIIQVQTPRGTVEVDIYTDLGFRVLSDLWTRSGWQRKLSYELTWLGIPIIQMPEDIMIMQELVHKVRPDVILETGTAHGGTAVFFASILELVGSGRLISIDVEIRTYNRLAIRAHPMSKRINLIEGSSTDDRVAKKVRDLIHPDETVLVVLDSNHTRDHVRKELENYSSLVTPGSFIVVFDGVMEMLTDAPNGKAAWESDNPAAAARDFLADHPEFEVDPYYNRLTVSYAPNGFLRRRVGHNNEL